MTRSSASPSANSPGPIRLAEVLAALSLATDLGTGKPMGHALRACVIGLAIGRQLGLGAAEQGELYYSFLLMHSGCTAFAWAMAPLVDGDEIAAIGAITLVDEEDPLALMGWMRRNVAPGAPLPARLARIARMAAHAGEAPEQGRGACEVAAGVAQRLGMPSGVQEAVRHYLERWDGRGPHGLRGRAIPLISRLLLAGLMIEAFYTARGRESAEVMLRRQQGKSFDPEVVDAFFAAATAELWQTVARNDLADVLLDLEPNSPHWAADEARLDDIALAVADFVDLKCAFTMGHSRETARLAERIARRMGLTAAEIATIRRAALVHDLGHVALPGRILTERERLSEADREKLRLHPYYTERILGRVPALAEAAAIAGRHHERVDGRGYYRGLSSSEIPVGAAILAVADAYHERWQAAGGRREPKEVVAAMQAEAGTWFATECVAALAQELGAAPPEPPRRRDWPAGLTDREVEVLRVLATGASNRQIARELVISERTVAHHLEHIYNKIGISSRAAAVFFGMEHELIR